METDMITITYADLMEKLIKENKELALENQLLKQQIKKSSCSEQDENEEQT